MLKFLLLCCSALLMAATGYGCAAAQESAREQAGQFHLERGAVQVWSDENFNALLTAIEGLSAHGLDPVDYGESTLKVLRAAPISRDRLATNAWFMAATHLLQGRTDPASLEPFWTLPPRNANLALALEAALEAGTIAASLERFKPSRPIYTDMQNELAWQEKQLREPFQIVSDGAPLEEDDEGPRVEQLRTRLSQLGWAVPAENALLFDEPLATAVEEFQESVGLNADGIVGPMTLTALNRTPQDKIDQLKVNMERVRWLPEVLGRRHLIVNIPGFHVTAYEDGSAVRTHLTIVGRASRPTPVFSDEIEYIDFNPWWETPPSLARTDELRLFQRDPDAVERLGFLVYDASGALIDASTIDWTALTPSTFPYRLRQKPGPLNALGQVKIIFPNPHNVYLHDTPARSLFDQCQRTFSSGCIRTQNPVELSKWLLEETPEWTPERIDEVVASKAETRATLTEKVPVYILYMTAITDGAGGISYLEDIYNRDGAVLSALQTVPE